MRSTPIYRLYGLAVSSPLDLPCPSAPSAAASDVRLRAGRRARFAALRPRTGAGRPSRRWFYCRRLPSGSTYLRWTGLFEFLVSADGRDIQFHRLPRATPESLSAYLLGQVLSFSLLAFGEEPLHGTVVVVDGEAIGFLGDCGYGKSTLGAAFLRLGFPVLTDDLVVLERTASGYSVQPGMPRLKLFPGVSRPVLGAVLPGPRLNDGTSKQILPLGPGQAFRRAAPLSTLYVLLPWLFYVSAIGAGLGMIIVESYLSGRAFGHELQIDLLEPLGRAMVVVLAVFGVLRIESIIHEGALGLAFQSTYEAHMFQAEFGLGVLLPIALLLSRRIRMSRPGLVAGGTLAVLGFIMHRLNVSVTALERSSGVHYTPSWMEITISVGLVAIGFAVFALAVRYLPVFHDHTRTSAAAP